MSALNRKRIADWLAEAPGASIDNLSGWVRTKRGNKEIAFIALSDGSTINTIQVVAELQNFDEELIRKIQTGASIKVGGKLVASQGSGQAVEVLAESIEVLGEADAEKFPLQKKKHTLEFLREIAHWRPRTITFGAILLIKHSQVLGIHKYFNDRHFYYIHAPIITVTDAEVSG